RVAKERIGLRAIEGVERAQPGTRSLDRAAAAVLRNLIQQVGPLAEAPGIEQEAFAVTEADLTNHRLDPRVHRGSIRGVRPTEAGPPQTDAVRINLRQRFEEADRIPDIVDLFHWDQAPSYPLAPAVTTVVEGQGDEPRLGKSLGIVSENQCAHSSEAMTEHDPRSSFVRLKVGGKKEVPLHPRFFAEKIYCPLIHRNTSRKRYRNTFGRQSSQRLVRSLKRGLQQSRR